MHRICSDEVRWKGTAFLKKTFLRIQLVLIIETCDVDSAKKWQTSYCSWAFWWFTGCVNLHRLWSTWFLDNGPFEANHIKKRVFLRFAFNYRDPYLKTPNCSGLPACSPVRPASTMSTMFCGMSSKASQLGSWSFFAPLPFRYQKQSMEPHHLGRFSMTRTLLKGTQLYFAEKRHTPVYASRASFFHSKVLRSCMVWHPFGRHRSTISGPPSSQRNMYQRQKTMWQNQQTWRKTWKVRKTATKIPEN